MGFLKKVKAMFHDDWCKNCQTQMQETKRQLYRLPMIVGNYQSHSKADYYTKNLVKVNCKADIPSGMYAFGVVDYHCTDCGHNIVKLSIFLPVREQEKYEDVIIFEKGELDEFLKR